MNCPKCNIQHISIEKLPDYPGMVAHCMCGYFKMSVENKLDEESKLHFCLFCNEMRVKKYSHIYCSRACYNVSQLGVEAGSKPIKGSIDVGREARISGLSESDCPHEGFGFFSQGHRNAWLHGFRS